MAATTNSLQFSLGSEKETEQLVQHVVSLWEKGLHGSTLILVGYLSSCRDMYHLFTSFSFFSLCVGVKGDLLLANHQALGLSERPDWHLVVLMAYADGLIEDQQHRRALVSPTRERERERIILCALTFISAFLFILCVCSITIRSRQRCWHRLNM